MADKQRHRTPRLYFANQLRGVAASLVVASHLVGVFWLMQGFLALTTLAPAQGGALPPLVVAITVEWFQPGPFGVGLFFLISGLVVPISLERHSAWGFIAARGLRIYPTYWMGLALQLIVLLVASHIWGHAIPYDWKTILANALLVHDLAGKPSIDLVNWTLTIELRFYLLVALLAPWLRRGNLAAVFGPSLAACVVALLVSRGISASTAPASSPIIYTISSELPFIILMLTGTLFNFHVRGQLRTSVFIIGLVAMSAMMAFAWWFSVLRSQFTHVLINDAYALVLFTTLYAARSRIGSNRALDALAAISYPIYLVHATLGYFVMKALMLLWHLSYLPSLAVAVIAAGSVATVMHVVVEKPCIRMGHILAN